MDPHFWASLGSAIVNGLVVLVAISVTAAAFTFLTGGTAPRHWPKRDDAEPEAHHH